MRPEEAIPAARAGAAGQRAKGGYAEDVHAYALRATSERISSDQLMEWAVIEPDPELVVSTRRWGAPISQVKRVLRHLLRQYLAQIESQQTRFNVHLLGRVVEQEQRLSVIEDWLREDSLGGEPPPRPAPARYERDP